MIGIYSITNIKNQRVYVGQSVDITRRWATHKRELKANSHYNQILQADYNKYGQEAFCFEVIELCKVDELNVKEEMYIQRFNSYLNGYKQNIGGCNIRGKNNPMYGITGKNAPRFKGYILQLSSTGEILGKFESSCEAANNLGLSSSAILKCLYAWQGKKYYNKYTHSTHNYQFIYEQDYYTLLPFHNFNHIIKANEYFPTLQSIRKGALCKNT